MKPKYLFTLLFFFTFGCSKTEPPVTPVVITPVVVPVKETPPLPPTSTTRLVPIKIESPLETITIKYLANTGLVTYVDFGKTKKSIQFIYNKENELIAGLTADQLGQEYFIDYFRDTKKNIYKVSYYVELSTHTTPTGYHLLTYNSLNQIAEAIQHSSKNILLNTYSYSYDLAKNRNSTITNQDDTKKTIFTFDQKNGLFKHVDHALLISLEFPHYLLNSNINNVVTKKGSAANLDYSYTYEYNEADFPSQITLSEANVKTVYKVTYKAI